MWFFVSALARVTFGAGAPGEEVSTLAILTISAFGPRSSCSVSPAARPVTLASRICVSPALAAGAPVVALLGCSVVADVPQIASGALVSISAAIVLYVLATATPAAWAWARGAVRVTFGAGEAGAGDGIDAIVAAS